MTGTNEIYIYKSDQVIKRIQIHKLHSRIIKSRYTQSAENLETFLGYSDITETERKIVSGWVFLIFHTSLLMNLIKILLTVCCFQLKKCQNDLHSLIAGYSPILIVPSLLQETVKVAENHYTYFTHVEYTLWIYI